MTLVETADDVAVLEVDDPGKVAYITQTTLSPRDVADVVDALSERFPSLVGPHSADICYATQNRQDAVAPWPATATVILVVGSGNSSNTARLVEVSPGPGAGRAHRGRDASSMRLHARGRRHRRGDRRRVDPAGRRGRVVDALGPPPRSRSGCCRTEHVNFPLPLEVR